MVNLSCGLYGGSVATKSTEPGSRSANSVTASPITIRAPDGSNDRWPPGSDEPRSTSCAPSQSATTDANTDAHRGSISKPIALRGDRQIEAPNSVPPTPAKG